MKADAFGAAFSYRRHHLLRQSKKGVIPHLMRDLHPLIWVGDIAPRSKNERIGVRYDGMDNITAILRFFGQPPTIPFMPNGIKQATLVIKDNMFKIPANKSTGTGHLIMAILDSRRANSNSTLPTE